MIATVVADVPWIVTIPVQAAVTRMIATPTRAASEMSGVNNRQLTTAAGVIRLMLGHCRPRQHERKHGRPNQSQLRHGTLSFPRSDQAAPPIVTERDSVRSVVSSVSPVSSAGRGKTSLR